MTLKVNTFGLIPESWQEEREGKLTAFMEENTCSSATQGLGGGERVKVEVLFLFL